MLVLGRLALSLAFVFSAASIIFLALGMRRDRKDLLRNGYYAVYAFFLMTIVAAAVLLQAFLKGDFRFGYVAQHSDASLSIFYRVAGFWAGQGGSFLLWLLLIALVALVIALLDLGKPEPLTGGAVMVLCATGAVFSAMMVFDHGSSPFVTAEAGATPLGLNPQLLHPAMVLHPPALFAGYVALSVPFAFAVSAMLLGRADKLWVKLSQKWALAGWLFLSLGIGLGAWWAYVVLGFGGYWGWDPVENTSLVPWLAATALLHSMTLYRTRGLLKRWALGLAAATFFFTILATWTTRTGHITSVHAFEENTLLTWILTAFLIVIVAAGAGLLVWRWRRYESSDEVENWMSRDFLYYLTNLLLTLFALALAFGTVVVPLTMNRTVGPATYNLVAQPLGVIVVALIAVCPLMAWRKTEGVALGRTLILPGVAAAVSVPLWLALGLQSNMRGFVGLVVCGFAAGAVLQLVLRTARKAAGPGRSLWAGLGRAFIGSRSRTAAYVVHLGMVLVVVGLIGSNVYRVEKAAIVTAKPGTTISFEGYALTYRGMSRGDGAQGSTYALARFDVTRHGVALGTLEPRSDVYPVFGAVVRTVILGGWKQDLFVVADAPFGTESKTIALRAVVFPLMRFVWLGSLLLCAGAGVSLWPKRRAQQQEAREGAAAGAAGDGRLDVASG